MFQKNQTKAFLQKFKVKPFLFSKLLNIITRVVQFNNKSFQQYTKNSQNIINGAIKSNNQMSWQQLNK